MVKRILNLINKEISGLHQAAYLLAFFAVCSQILALVRDRIFASQFGAGNVLDVYYSAFRLPDFLFVTVASVVSVSVLIPFIIERLDDNKESAKKFIDNIFSFFFVVMILSGIVVFFLTPYILKFIFPTFSISSDFSSLVNLTRILLLSPVLLGFSNLLASITQASKRFFLYAISPVLYNIGIILGAIFLYPVFGIYGLGMGVVLGAFLHFAVQIPFIFNQNLFPKIVFPVDFKIIRKVVFTSVPRTITVSSNELVKIFLVSMASVLTIGSVSIFNFSYNLQSVPFSIIGMSYSLAAFPVLVKLFSGGDAEKFVKQMIASSRHIIFWSIPVTIMFIVLRAQIVRTVLGAGKFDWNDTRLTAAALAIFTFSLVAQNLMNLFVRSFYSRGKTKVPLVMNMISAVFMITSSYLLVQFFQSNQFFRNFFESLLKVSDISGTVVLMLPLGFTIGMFLNTIMHWIGFNKEFPSYSKSVLKTFYQITGAGVVMGFVTHKSLYYFDMIFNTQTLFGIFMQGLMSGLMGIMTLILVLYLLKSDELKESWITLHKKFWKEQVVGPDAEL